LILSRVGLAKRSACQVRAGGTTSADAVVASPDNLSVKLVERPGLVLS
jgi:hypothetical protein